MSARSWSSRRRARCAALVMAGSVAATGLLGGCARAGAPEPSGPGGEPTAAAPSSPALAPTGAPTPTGSASPGTPGTPPSSARCPTGSLRGSLRPANSAAGNRYAYLVLTNTGGTDCRVYGYVGMRLVGPSGEEISTRVVRESPPAPVLITLAPGRMAHARLHWSMVPGPDEPVSGPCQPEPSRILVTPPDERTQLTLTWRYGPVCQSGRITVTPLAPGRGPDY